MEAALYPAAASPTLAASSLSPNESHIGPQTWQQRAVVPFWPVAPRSLDSTATS